MAVNYSGKKVAIAGYGIDGEASLKYFQDLGADVTLLDEDPNVEEKAPDGVSVIAGGGAFSDLEQYDLVVRSPGLHPDKLAGATITTQMLEFMKACPVKIIGVTGTKGKGTTSTLIHKMLEAAGNRSWLVGNIGTPPLSILDEISDEDVVVFEMSSFQLYDVEISPHIAVILPVGTDHLDFHIDREDYVNAKSNISANQTKDDISIYHANDETAKAIAETSIGRKVAYLADDGAHLKDDGIYYKDNLVSSVHDVGLVGEHNLENICAAIAVVQEVTDDYESAKTVIREFKGLEHRTEFVSEIDGIKYFNDSFATTPDSTIAAIKSFEEPKVLILGGSEKEADFSALAKQASESDIRALILIGKEAQRIEMSLKEAGVSDELIVHGGSNMTEIIEQARDSAKSGDVVILSPACASFDMFESYKDRGEQFKQGVAGLVT